MKNKNGNKARATTTNNRTRESKENIILLKNRMNQNYFQYINL